MHPNNIHTESSLGRKPLSIISKQQKGSMNQKKVVVIIEKQTSDYFTNTNKKVVIQD
jgi:hypothetical protein